MFVQNAQVDYPLFVREFRDVDREQLCGQRLAPACRHLITGVPVNNWPLVVPEGVCIDVVPMGETEYVARPYGF